MTPRALGSNIVLQKFSLHLDNTDKAEVNGIPNAMLLEVITLSLIRHGVNLSVLEDEDMKKVLNHILGLSVSADYLYNSVAFPMEEKLLSYVCLVQIRSHSMEVLEH